MTKVNNFWVPKIDSFKIWVNQSDLEIIDNTIIENLYVVDSLGEIVDEIEGKSKNIDYVDGRAFKFWRRRHNDINTKITTEYIGIIINAKHLKESYMTGVAHFIYIFCPKTLLAVCQPSAFRVRLAHEVWN